MSKHGFYLAGYGSRAVSRHKILNLNIFFVAENFLFYKNFKKRQKNYIQVQS